MPRGLPKLSSFFNGFLVKTSTSRTFKMIVFPYEKQCFLNHPSKLASTFDAIWVPTWLHFPSKIHPNPLKIKFQEAFKNWLILASIFDRFGLRFGGQVGAMLATKTPPRRPKTASKMPPSTKRPPRGPKRPQEAHLGPILGGFGGPFFFDFWLIFWLIFERILMDFSLNFYPKIKHAARWRVRSFAALWNKQDTLEAKRIMDFGPRNFPLTTNYRF